MAVARYSSDTTATVDAEATTITMATLSCAGADRAVLALLQLDPTGSAPSNLVARYYYDYPSYQTMTLIESWNSGGIYFYMYGLVPANASGTGEFYVQVTWTNNCYPLIYVQSLTGVKQTSVATAFTNATHASGTSSSAAVTISSATGNMVFAHHNTNTGDMDQVNDSILYDIQAWPDYRSPVWDSAGNYANGSTSVTLDCSLISSVAWRSQGVNVVAQPLGQPIAKRSGGVQFMNKRVFGGGGTNLWRKSLNSQLLVPKWV